MKKVFFASFFFRNISKTAKTILLKKIERNYRILVYKKTLMSEHQKIYILRDINDFINTSVSMLSNFVYALAQKPV